MKVDVFDGSVVNGLRQPILYSFVFDKLLSFEVFLPNQKRYTIKKVNKSNSNTITFYLEDDYNEEVIFNGETLTFTLQID